MCLFVSKVSGRGGKGGEGRKSRPHPGARRCPPAAGPHLSCACVGVCARENFGGCFVRNIFDFLLLACYTHTIVEVAMC